MSTELERVREKLYERDSITLTNVFERLVREDQDKISREDERAKAADKICALLSPAPEVCPKCGSIKRGVRREVTECVDEHGMQDIFPCNHKWHGGACGD